MKIFVIRVRREGIKIPKQNEQNVLSQYLKTNEMLLLSYRNDNEVTES